MSRDDTGPLREPQHDRLKSWWLLACLIALMLPSAAAPVSPKPSTKRYPLRTLFAEADAIVVADVSAVTVVGTNARCIRLDIRETLRGPASPTRAVGVIPSLCEGPPPYPEGESVLAFLTTHWPTSPPRPSCSGTEEVLRTLGRSRGSKALKPRSLLAHVEALRRLDEIERLDSEADRRAALADWVVSLVEEPLTREEGLYDLTVFSSNQRKSEPVRIQRFGPELHARLMAVFEALPADDPHLLQLATVLTRSPSQRAERALRSRLESLAKDPTVAPDVVDQLRAAVAR